MDREEVLIGSCWGDLKGTEYFESLGALWKIILKCILKKSSGKTRIGSCSRQEKLASPCERSTKLWVPQDVGNLCWLRNF
jgi:hypothetical protein